MNQKGISSIVIILIIVGILVVVGGIWYFYQKPSVPRFADDYYNDLYKRCSDGCCKESVERMAAGNFKLPETDKDCPTNFQPNMLKCITSYKWCEPKTDETTGWQTYQNEEYGFEVKFPSDLVLQKNTGEAYTSFLGKLAGKSYFLQFGYISQNTLNTMGINYCQSYPNDSRCENYSSDSLEFLIDWNIETEGAFTQSRAEILKPEGGIIIISILHSPSQDIRSFFRQILSTFKFTE